MKFLCNRKKMAANITKNQVLTLYKCLLRESQKFSNYNFRSYALRRVKDSFKDSKSITDPKIIKKEYDFAQQNLDMIKRQVVIGDMFRTDKLVIENLR